MKLLLAVVLTALAVSLCACGAFGGAAADYNAAKDRAEMIERARKAAPPLHVDLKPPYDPYKAKPVYQ